jgi:hypothetical protein
MNRLLSAVVVLAFGLTAGTAAAGQPSPSPTCWAAVSNLGQEADLAHSSIGTDGYPGLSAFTPPRRGFSVGDFTTFVQDDSCGMH